MKKLVVTLSYTPNEQELARLKEQLFRTFGEAEIEYHTDEEMLGGIIVFDGENVYDGSIRGRLKRASQALKK